MTRKNDLLQHDCSRPGCKIKADCTPKLLVPTHPLSTNTTFAGVSSVLWLPLCNAHFSAATVREFLSDDVIAGMRGSITYEFRHNNATPDWNKAQIVKVGRFTKEFQQYEKIYLNVRAGQPGAQAVAAAKGGLN